MNISIVDGFRRVIVPSSRLTLLPSMRLLPVICLTLPVICLIVGCGPDDALEVDDTPVVLETFEAEVLALELTSWPKIVRSQGNLFADEISIVGVKVAGRVAEINFDLGDFVTEGDPLVTIEQEELKLQVRQAEAEYKQVRSAVGLQDDDLVEDLDPLNSPPVRQERALWNEAKRSLQRADRLRKQAAMSASEFDIASANERVAEARYASAVNSVREKIALIGVRKAELSITRQRLSDAVIYAPLDGYIERRLVAKGAYLSVGQSIAVIVRTNPLRFRGTVPERHAQGLSIGQTVNLSIETVDGIRSATVTRVSPALNQASRSLLFEAEIDNSDYKLRTGLFVEAELVIDEEAKALIIPESAIVEFAGTEKVWKVVDGVSAEQSISTGTRRAAGREILEGLEVGDEVLLDGQRGRVAQIKRM